MRCYTAQQNRVTTSRQINACESLRVRLRRTAPPCSDASVRLTRLYGSSTKTWPSATPGWVLATSYGLSTPVKAQRR